MQIKRTANISTVTSVYKLGINSSHLVHIDISESGLD